MSGYTINIINRKPFKLVFQSRKEALAEWDQLLEYGIEADKLTLTNEEGKEIATAIVGKKKPSY